MNVNAATLSVIQTAQWVSGKMIFRTPKTAKSRRSIELSTATVKCLKEHRQSQLEERMALGPAYREQGLVFADATGETLHPNGGLRSNWVKITQSAGLPGLRFHDLRHAHASMMLAQGDIEWPQPLGEAKRDSQPLEPSPIVARMIEQRRRQAEQTRRPTDNS